MQNERRGYLHLRNCLIELMEITEGDKCTVRMGDMKKALYCYKWLSYQPDSRIKKIEELSAKKSQDLTKEELELLLNYKEEKELSEKFKRYISPYCYKDDVLPVFDYMELNDIEDIMKSKLTKEEFEEAKKIIENHRSLSYKELSSYVDEKLKKENYLDLSMVEAYAIYELGKISDYRGYAKFCAELEADLNENAMARTLSYNYANRPLK